MKSFWRENQNKGLNLWYLNLWVVTVRKFNREILIKVFVVEILATSNWIFLKETTRQRAS